MADNKDEISGQPIFAIARPINPNEQDSASHANVTTVPIPAENVPFAVAETYSDNIPVAPSLHRYNDNSPEAQNHAVARQTRIGSEIGKINTVEEREHIRKANDRSRAQTSFEKARIDKAQQMARQREREGTDVKEDIYFNHEALVESAMEKKVREQDVALEAATSKGGHGYKVKEYDVSKYKGDEYSASYEYKSIYD